MDRYPPITSATVLARLLGRWVLLGAVIAGVLAMHVLSEPDGFDGHTMPDGMMSTVNAPMAADMSPSAMADAGQPDMLAPGSSGRTAAAASATPSRSQTTASPGPDAMAAMTCCVLFLLIAAGLLLAWLLQVIRERPTRRVGSAAMQRFSLRRRGPPSTLTPQTLLCVLRV